MVPVIFTKKNPVVPEPVMVLEAPLSVLAPEDELRVPSFTILPVMVFVDVELRLAPEFMVTLFKVIPVPVIVFDAPVKVMVPVVLCVNTAEPVVAKLPATESAVAVADTFASVMVKLLKLYVPAPDMVFPGPFNKVVPVPPL